MNNSKVCSRSDCDFAGLEQPLESFNNKSANKDGKRSRCRDCQHKEYQTYYPNRPKSTKEQNFIQNSKRSAYYNWDTDNKRRCKANGCSYEKVSEEDYDILKETPCEFCGSMENHTIDHIIPIYLGGPHKIDNLRALCHPHNVAERNRLIRRNKNDSI